MRELAAVGVDLDDLGRALEAEGIISFHTSSAADVFTALKTPNPQNRAAIEPGIDDDDSTHRANPQNL